MTKRMGMPTLCSGRYCCEFTWNSEIVEKARRGVTKTKVTRKVTRPQTIHFNILA